MSDAPIPKEWLTRKTTIEEIERFSMAQIRKLRLELPGLDIPSVPFGFENKKWSDFKGAVWATDEIWEFASPAALWHEGAGRVGYVAIRHGFVVASMMTGRLPS